MASCAACANVAVTGWRGVIRAAVVAGGAGCILTTGGGTREKCVYSDGKGERVGVFRINWYPLGPPRPSFGPGPSPLELWRYPFPRAERTASPPAHRSIVTATCTHQSAFLPPLLYTPSCRPSWIWRKKKRAGIFLSIPPGSLFFTRFFLPLPRSPGPAASGFFFFFLPYLSTATVLCPDTAIFFHTGQSAAGLAEGRGQGKKRASRARPGGDSANHLSKQDRLFYSGVYFYFISFYFIFFFRCLMPPVRELFFSILTATFSVRWPFAARLSIQRFQNFARVNTHFSVSVLKYARLVHTINRVYSDCLCVQFITWIRPNRINMCCIIFTVIKNSYGFLINISYRCNLNIFLNRWIYSPVTANNSFENIVSISNKSD